MRRQRTTRPFRLTRARILKMAKVHFRQKGQWPTKKSGPVIGEPNETWGVIDTSLRRGSRALAGGSSLARLLAEAGLKRHQRESGQLTRARILKMAKVHFRQKGQWPTNKSGPVIGEPNETWGAIDASLRHGNRGLASGSSLARLLAEAGLKRHHHEPPPLNLEQVLTWAEADQRQMGKWPNRDSGPVRAAPGENWATIDGCLRHGRRGFPGGMTLAGLLRYHRNVLLRARQILPVKDGQRLITTPVELTAVLVSRGPLQQPDLLYSLRERQRKFQEQAGGQSRRRRR